MAGARPEKKELSKQTLSNLKKLETENINLIHEIGKAQTRLEEIMNRMVERKEVPRNLSFHWLQKLETLTAGKPSYLLNSILKDFVAIFKIFETVFSLEDMQYKSGKRTDSSGVGKPLRFENISQYAGLEQAKLIGLESYVVAQLETYDPEKKPLHPLIEKILLQLKEAISEGEKATFFEDKVMDAINKVEELSLSVVMLEDTVTEKKSEAAADVALIDLDRIKRKLTEPEKFDETKKELIFGLLSAFLEQYKDHLKKGIISKEGFVNKSLEEKIMNLCPEAKIVELQGDITKSNTNRILTLIPYHVPNAIPNTLQELISALDEINFSSEKKENEKNIARCVNLYRLLSRLGVDGYKIALEIIPTKKEVQSKRLKANDFEKILTECFKGSQEKVVELKGRINSHINRLANEGRKRAVSEHKSKI